MILRGRMYLVALWSRTWSLLRSRSCGTGLGRHRPRLRSSDALQSIKCTYYKTELLHIARLFMIMSRWMLPQVKQWPHRQGASNLYLTWPTYHKTGLAWDIQICRAVPPSIFNWQAVLRETSIRGSHNWYCCAHTEGAYTEMTDLLRCYPCR